jgi:hypothetical protein
MQPMLRRFSARPVKEMDASNLPTNPAIHDAQNAQKPTNANSTPSTSYSLSIRRNVVFCKSYEKQGVGVQKNDCDAIQQLYDETGKSDGNLARKHHRNSWLNSEISIPAMTINLQLSISRGSSSSGNWQETRQY